jgi:hypothetical protein
MLPAPESCAPNGDDGIVDESAQAVFDVIPRIPYTLTATPGFAPGVFVRVVAIRQ